MKCCSIVTIIFQYAFMYALLFVFIYIQKLSNRKQDKICKIILDRVAATF